MKVGNFVLSKIQFDAYKSAGFQSSPCETRPKQNILFPLLSTSNVVLSSFFADAAHEHNVDPWPLGRVLARLQRALHIQMTASPPTNHDPVASRTSDVRRRPPTLPCPTGDEGRMERWRAGGEKGDHQEDGGTERDQRPLSPPKLCRT